MLSEKLKLMEELARARDLIDRRIVKIASEIADSDFDLEISGENLAEPDTAKYETPIKEYLPSVETPAPAEKSSTLDPAPALNKYGKWSVKYDKCQNCGTRERKHKSGGYCTACYPKCVLKKQQAEKKKNIEPAPIKYECGECGTIFETNHADPICWQCHGKDNLKIVKI